MATPTETIAAAGPSNMKLFAAECVGTGVLFIVGPGSAILAASTIGNPGVALAFGFVLLAMAYTIGHVSGCHINPAVTLAFWLSRKVTIVQAGYYWVAQFLGALLGGLVIFIASDAGDLDNTTAGPGGPQIFAANGWGSDIGSPFGLGSVIVVEIFFTALLIWVVLSTTTKGFPVGFGGLAAGLTLGMIHLATIPVDNTSVNPARSFGAAVFSGTDALAQLWAFIVFPLIGGVLGVLVWLLVHEERLEDTMFGGQKGLVAARDKAAGVTGRVEDRLAGLSSGSDRAVLLVLLGRPLRPLPLPHLGQRLGAADVGDRARLVVAELAGRLAATPRARRPATWRGWRRRSSTSPRRSRAAPAAGGTARRRWRRPSRRSRRCRRSRRRAAVHSSWIRRPIAAGKRWIAGFSAHTATKSSTSIAGDLAGVEVAEPLAQRLGAGERPLHRHLLVEQHADQQGRAIAVEQAVGRRVAGDVQGAGHVLDLTSPRRRVGRSVGAASRIAAGLCVIRSRV